jgi:hypothetical protein
VAVPPIEVLFKPSGHTEVLAALKSITDATLAAARARSTSSTAERTAAKSETDAIQAKVKATRDYATAASAASAASAKGMSAAEKSAREAIKAAKDLERANKDAAKAIEEMRRGPAKGRDFFGNDIELRAQSKGVEQMSGSKAFNEIFGRTAAQLLGLYGPAGQLVGIFNTLKGAVSLAADALTGFGSFLLRDIIQPQLKLGTQTTQMSNRIGGTSSPAAIKAAINGTFASNAQLELGEVQDIYSTALDKTKSLPQAQLIASITAKANKAYGFDPKRLAEYISGARAQNSGLSQNAFENLITNEIAAGKDAGGNFDQFLAQIGRIQKSAADLNGTGSPDVQAGNHAALTALVAAGAKGGRSAAETANGLSGLIQNIKDRPEAFGLNAQAVAGASAKDLIETIIPKILTGVGGNLHDPKLLGQFGGAIGTKVLNPTSRQFLQSLNVDSIYNNTKGSASDKEAAVRDALKALVGVGDAAKASAGAALLDADAKKVEEDSGYQFEQALRDLKVALVGVMPVVTDQLIPALKQATPAIAELLKEVADAIGHADIKGVMDALVKAVSLTAFGILKAYDWIDRKFLGGSGVGQDTLASVGKIAGIAEYQVAGGIAVSGSGKGISGVEQYAADKGRAGKSSSEFGTYDENGDFSQTVLQQMAELAAKAKEASKALGEVAGKDPSRSLGFGSPYRANP